MIVLSLFSNLFVDGIKYNKEDVPNKDVYPFNIESIKNLDEIRIDKPVTFFIGENGVGKSTLIEALAISLKLNPEGGSQNINFKTKDSHSSLSNYLTVYSTGNLPKTRYFLRAVASEIQRLVEEDCFSELKEVYGGNLHECSHG